MKRFSLWTLFCLFALLVVTSCKKENIDTVVETEETITPITTTITPPANALLGRASASSQSTTEAEGLNFDCFEIIFPFNLLDSEGTIHEIEQEAAFISLLEEGDSSVYIVDFVYPISISLNEEEIREITGSEQLGELFAECVPNGGWDEFVFPAYLIDDENSCYKTVYPISLKDEDENIITVGDEAAFIEVLVEKEVYFHFPINLTDGEAVVSIANVDDLFNTLFTCNEYYQDSTAWDWGGGFEYIGCFQVNFPLTVVVADGGEKVVNNHEELCELMLQGELVDYAYPLTLTSPEGNEVNVNSAEALEEVLAQCAPEGPQVFSNSDIILLLSAAQSSDSNEFGGCYTINYPIEVTYYDEDYTTAITGTFNNAEEIWALPTLYGNGESAETQAELVYPLEVTQVSDNQTITFNNSEDISEVIAGCYDGIGQGQESDLFLLAIFSQPLGEDTTSVCYTINFPISGNAIDVNGNTQTVTFNSFEESFFTQPEIGLDSFSIIELVYPVDITLQSDGQIITLNDAEDLYGILDVCSSEGL